MKTVIEMAHETLERMKADEHCREQYWSATDDELQAFAELVRADEREQRTWVGLTNNEVNSFAAGCHLGNSVQDAIYKAVAKIKEKNT